MAKKKNENITESEFWIVNEEGKEVKCDTLFTFESEETHKHYIVYTDNSLNVDGSTKVYASTYDPQGSISELKPIESEKEWKIIETILAEIQESVSEGKEKNNYKVENFNGKKVDGDQQKSILNEDISWDDVFADFPSYEPTKSELPYDEFVNYLGKEEGETGRINDSVLLGIFDRLEKEKEITHIDYLFSVLDKNGFTDSMRYYSLGMEAYSNDNFVVSEEAFQRAVRFCEQDERRIGYANNLAYLIRRKEVRKPEEMSNKQIVELLKPGVAKKETLSLINMALFWALNVGGDEDWKIADQLCTLVDKSEVHSAYFWWSEVGKREDEEGFLVHLLLIRNGKILSSPLGDIGELFAKVKSKYKSIPEEFRNIVTPFDGGDTDKLPNVAPWLNEVV